MKKVISLTIALCLVLGSFSVVFASSTSWDTSDQTNLANVASRLYYNGSSAAYYLYNIASSVNTISNNLTDVKALLSYGGHSISYWVEAISTWMSPIYNAISSLPVDLTSIKSALWRDNGDGSSTSWLSLLTRSLALDTWQFNGVYLTGLGNTASSSYYGTFPQAILQALSTINIALGSQYYFDYVYGYAGYNSSQSITDWADVSTQSSFTPSSATDGIYKYLASIQTPVARLAYVLANDQEIEARDAAAQNQQAVVDDFIDSSGSGSASVSDFGEMASASGSVQQNFNTGYSSTSIWDVFNQDHYGWFSQECASSLDTTGSSTRRSAPAYSTPLLDAYYEEILSLGGGSDD